MKEEKKMHSIDNLVSTLDETNNYFRSQVQKQVNVALTLRNWLFGLYIVEYELNGADRAVYGQKLFKEIANGLNISKAYLNPICMCIGSFIKSTLKFSRQCLENSNIQILRELQFSSQ